MLESVISLPSLSPPRIGVNGCGNSPLTRPIHKASVIDKEFTLSNLCTKFCLSSCVDCVGSSLYPKGVIDRLLLKSVIDLRSSNSKLIEEILFHTILSSRYKGGSIAEKERLSDDPNVSRSGEAEADHSIWSSRPWTQIHDRDVGKR